MGKIDVIKQSLQFEQLLNQDCSNTILREEYLIPDTHPDVERILLVEAKPTITNKDIVGDKAIVEGSVEYNVIYIPRDDDAVVNSVNYSEKFTNSFDIGENEHKVICEVECKVEHIDASIMNERKISIEGVLQLDWQVYLDTEFDFVEDLEATQGVEILKESDNIKKLAFSKEVEMVGKSVLRVGMDKPQVSKILKCSLRLHKKEMKSGEDKVYLGCYCKINILYVADDTNDIMLLEDDVYVSQDEEIIGVAPNMISYATYNVKNTDVVIEEDDLGEARIINVEFLIGGKVSVFSEEAISIIKDAYSPKFPINIEKNVHNIDALLGVQSSENIIKDNIYLKEGDFKPEKIINVTGDVIVNDKKISDDKVIVDGIIKAQVIYKTNDENNLYGHVSGDIPFTTMIDIVGSKDDMKAVIKAALESLDAVIEANTIAIKASVIINAKVFYEIEKEFISDVVEGEDEVADKKASITIYVVGKGDTLWDLAKKYCCTMQELKKINDLEEEYTLQEGEKLIIPGRAVF